MWTFLTRIPGWRAVAAVFGIAVVLAFVPKFTGFSSALTWSIPVLGLAFVLMWFGLEIGRWLAFLVLVVASLISLFCASLELTREVAHAGLFFVLCLANGIGAAVLLFSEAVSDYLAARFGRRARAVDWAAVIAPLLAARHTPPSRLQPVGSAQTAAAMEAAGKRARFGRTMAIGVVCVALGGVILVFVAVGGAALNLIEEQAAIQAQTRAQIDSAVAAAPGLLEKLGTFISGGIFIALGSAFAILLMAVVTALTVPAAYFAFFVAPFLLSLPLNLPFALRWRDPARVLLLRPFHRQEITGGLSKFVTQSVSGFGHVYTLADIALRVPLYVRIPLVLGQVALFSFRLQRVRAPHDVFLVCRAMRRRVMRNLNWVFSLDKIFAVACTDDAWQAAVSRLAFEADLILIDLSGAKQNVVWELRQCEALGILDRVLLLTREAELQSTLALLSSIGHGALVADRVLTYDRADSEARARVADAIAQKLIASRDSARPAPLSLPGFFDDPSRRAQWKAALISIAVVALGAAILYAVNRPGPLLPFARVAEIPGTHYDSRLVVRGPRSFVTTRREDGAIQITDLESDVGVAHEAGSSRRNLAVMSADGRRLAHVEQHLVTVRDLAGGRVSSLQMPGAPFSTVMGLELSGNGEVLAISSFPNKVTLWRPGDASAYALIADVPNRLLLFSPDDASLLAADQWGSVEVWTLGATPALRCRWKGDYESEAIVWNRDSTRIAVGVGTSGVEVRDARNCSVLYTAPEKKHRVKSIAFGRAGDDLVWTTGFETMYYSSGKKVRKFAHPDSTTYGPGQAWLFRIAVSESARYLFGVSSDGKVVIWDLSAVPN